MNRSSCHGFFFWKFIGICIWFKNGTRDKAWMVTNRYFDSVHKYLEYHHQQICNRLKNISGYSGKYLYSRGKFMLQIYMPFKDWMLCKLIYHYVTKQAQTWFSLGWMPTREHHGLFKTKSKNNFSEKANHKSFLYC